MPYTSNRITLVPRLTANTAVWAASAFSSLKEAWKAVCEDIVSKITCRMGSKIADRKQKTHDTQAQQTSTHVGDSAVVDLLSESKTSQEEGHAKNKKQVGQDGAKNRSLYNADLVFGKSDDEDDELDCVAESDIEQCADRITKTTGHAFGGVTEQSCKRHDSDCIQGEDDAWAHVSSLGCDTDGYEDQQDIDPTVAESILCMDEEAFAGLDSAGGHGEFRCSGGISAIGRLYGGISSARSFGLDREWSWRMC